MPPMTSYRYSVERRPLGRVVATSLAGALLLGITLASPAAAANNVVFLAFFGDCQFRGTAAGSLKTVKIEWRDSDGTLKSKHAVSSNGAGEFTTRCEPGELIENGDVLKTTIGTSIRTFTMPKVTAQADRETDVVSGKVSPAPASLFVEVVTYEGGFALNGWQLLHLSSPAVVSGTFTTSGWDSAPDIRGWDDVYVDWINARGDTAVRYFAAEGMRIWLRQQFLEVTGNPGQAVSVSLERSASPLADSDGRLNRDGRLSADFLDADGDPIRVIAGDEISADFAGDASFTVPTMIVSINKTTDDVEVDCGTEAGLGVLVLVHPRDLSKVGSRAWYEPGGASYTIFDFSSSPAYNIVAGEKVDVFCKLPTGDVFAKSFTVV